MKKIRVVEAHYEGAKDLENLAFKSNSEAWEAIIDSIKNSVLTDGNSYNAPEYYPVNIRNVSEHPVQLDKMNIYSRGQLAWDYQKLNSAGNDFFVFDSDKAWFELYEEN